MITVTKREWCSSKRVFRTWALLKEIPRKHLKSTLINFSDSKKQKDATTQQKLLAKNRILNKLCSISKKCSPQCSQLCELITPIMKCRRILSCQAIWLSHGANPWLRPRNKASGAAGTRSRLCTATLGHKRTMSFQIRDIWASAWAKRHSLEMLKGQRHNYRLGKCHPGHISSRRACKA